MRPTRRLLKLALGLVAAGAVASSFDELRAASWIAFAVFALVTGIAALAAWLQTPPGVTRSVPASLPVGVTRKVRLEVANPGKRRLTCLVHDHHPHGCEVEGSVRQLEIGPSSALAFTYTLRPTERGDHEFSGTDVLVRAPLGLFERRFRIRRVEKVHVFPNFAAVARFALHAVEDAVRQLGVRRVRRRGEGVDFDHLREYRIGDSPRQIDWKATSRRRHPIARQFREERDQRIVFLVDCGRRMRARDGALAHFDHALDAVLLLAYVALRQGDSVGIQATGGVDRWLPPIRGRSGMTVLLERVYDLQPTLAPFDPLDAATKLVKRLPRRSLVLWITNLRDVDTKDVRAALALLATKHLVVLASMREAIVDEVATRPVRELGDALVVTAAEQYRRERTAALEKVGTGGLLMLDTEPRALPRALVSRYLEIKRAGML